MRDNGHILTALTVAVVALLATAIWFGYDYIHTGLIQSHILASVCAGFFILTFKAHEYSEFLAKWFEITNRNRKHYGWSINRIPDPILLWFVFLSGGTIITCFTVLWVTYMYKHHQKIPYTLVYLAMSTGVILFYSYWLIEKKWHITEEAVIQKHNDGVVFKKEEPEEGLVETMREKVSEPYVAEHSSGYNEAKDENESRQKEVLLHQEGR